MNETLDSNLYGSSNRPKEKLSGSGGVLTLGILSIILAGLVGLILGIIALNNAKRHLETYQQDVERYESSSVSQLKAGRTCAIIGVCLSGLSMLVIGIAAASN